MAGKNKTNAWNSIVFIKEHLPLWKEKGMTEGFLNSVIVPKYKGCSLDVRSAIECDVTNFGTVYNQPDFIIKLKEICKKFRLPYGKVKPEITKKVEEDASVLMMKLYDTKDVNQKRFDDKEKELGFKNIEDHLVKMGYIPHEISNIDKLLKRVIDARTSGDKKLVLNKTSLELLLSVARDKLSVRDIYKVIRLKEESIRRYYTPLERAGLGKISKNKRTPEFFVINYNEVKFKDKYKEKKPHIAINNLFGV